MLRSQLSLTFPKNPLPPLLLLKKKREEEGGEKNEVNCTTPRLCAAAPSSPRPRTTTTTTTAGSSHARRRSTVAFTQHTGSSLSACRPVALTAPRTRQQVGARVGRVANYFMLAVSAWYYLLSLTQEKPIWGFRKSCIYISRKYL